MCSTCPTASAVSKPSKLAIPETLRTIRGSARFPSIPNWPVSHVSFWDACRFWNWLHNGQGDGDTKTDAYTLNGYTGTDGRRVLERDPGVKWFVPTDNC